MQDRILPCRHLECEFRSASRNSTRHCVLSVRDMTVDSGDFLAIFTVVARDKEDSQTPLDELSKMPVEIWQGLFSTSGGENERG